MNKEQLRPFFKEIYERSDRVIQILLVSYFVLGIILAAFYDTWLVGIAVGALSLLIYFMSKWMFPGRRVNQYAASLCLGIFMAQFIYQMHGLFEMHFTAFIAVLALITYQNKWAFIPITLFILIHHSVFAYIQYVGVDQNIEAYRNIYFTQLDYMDLQTFVFHAGLYGVAAIISMIYAHNLAQQTKKDAYNIISLREVERSTRINIEFAREIAKGEYGTVYELSENDKMGAALLEMRDSLKSSAIREKEDRFINAGLAEAGDLIRNNSNNLDVLADKVISYLVNYIGANQGGLFLVNKIENEVVLELKGCYAYGRKKFLEGKVKPGDSLVGQCYIEKENIYLTEIPADYVRITSGLGEATPSCLLIVPIKNDDGIQGVLEFASFKEIPSYKIQFLNRLSENLATAVHSTKLNETTRVLYEESQQQAEEMRSQEEEMRQNMEELQATQEEMHRKEREYLQRIAELENALETQNS